MTTGLDFTNLAKRFPPDIDALAGVSLSVAPGEIVCLLGPSGCGKSTLLRTLAGLETPDAGRIAFDDVDVTALPPHQRRFGLVFQSFALFPHLDVAGNVGYGLRIRGDAPAAIEARVAEMLDLVQLTGYGARRVDRLSGGQMQRVALARALAVAPRVMLLDEPLGALDRALREELASELREILRAVAVPAVYVTHDQTEAFLIADRIAVMRAGRLEQVAQARDLRARPATPFVARFLGFDNLIAGQSLGNGQIETPFGTLHVPHARAPGTPVTILLPPRALAAEKASAGPGLSAQVVQCRDYGRYTKTIVAVAGVQLALEHAPDQTWQVGEGLSLTIDPTRVLVYADHPPPPNPRVHERPVIYS